MSEKQEIINIQKTELLDKVGKYANEGFRMVQVSCTKLDDNFQLDYSFDKDYKFVNLRLNIPVKDAKIPSVSNIYWNVFTYENEIHDLFGIEITDINIDYKGKFYRTSMKTPFNTPPKQEEEKK